MQKRVPLCNNKPTVTKVVSMKAGLNSTIEFHTRLVERQKSCSSIIQNCGFFSQARDLQPASPNMKSSGLPLLYSYPKEWTPEEEWEENEDELHDF